MSSLDSTWQKEQNDFLEKQKQRQRQAAPSTVEKALQPDPKRPAPKFKEAYTRDPNLLFRSDDGSTVKLFPPPMNNSQQGDSGAQPVKYSKVALVHTMGQFQKDTFFEAATVNYLTGQVKLFQTENEYFQGLAAFDDVVRLPSTKKYTNLYYVLSVVEFLQRGHSLLDPACRCVHRYEEERARELGISLPRVRRGGVEDKTSIRDGECTLSKERRPRSAQEIAHEIAVGDLYSIKDQNGARLVDAMAASKKIAILEPEGKEWHRFAFRATFERVSNKQELLLLINGLDLCLKEPSDKETYNGVKQDLEALAEEGQIYSLFNAEQRAAVVFPRRKQFEFPVDDDIKALWRENPPPKLSRVTHEELERILKAEALVPTKQAAPVKDSGKKDQKKRRRRVRKINPHAHLTLSKS